jgi:hypothetical protein
VNGPSPQEKGGPVHRQSPAADAAAHE